MIYTQSDFKSYARPNLKGGGGEVLITEFVPKEAMTNCRLICEQVVPTGASIGRHVHLNETEFYLIHKGTGIVIEADGEKPVGPGDVVVTGHGEMHSVVNTGDDDLVMTAIIVTH
ncbi:MAG: cupin domain-containing protein [Hyphomicrobiales bacterium]